MSRQSPCRGQVAAPELLPLGDEEVVGAGVAGRWEVEGLSI
jgi:hypothetical protein